MSIIGQLRNWTPEQDAGRSDFDELAPSAVSTISASRAEDTELINGKLVQTTDEQRGYRRGAVEKLARQHASVSRPTIPVRRSTPGQDGYIASLLRQLDGHNKPVADVARAYLAAHLPLSFAQASETIDRLKVQLAKPAVVMEAEPAPARGTGLAAVLADVPEGRYALALDDDEHSVRFYRVVLSQRGNKYMKIGHANGSGVAWDFLPVERGSLDVARRIAADPREAMLRYGRTIGECGHCGRVLTNDESRAAGIGPICAAKG